jgi:hypothetical protein
MFFSVPAVVVLGVLAVAVAPPRDDGGTDDGAADEEQRPDALRRADARAHAGPHLAAAPPRRLFSIASASCGARRAGAAKFHDCSGGGK